MIRRSLKKFGMQGCKPAKTSFQHGFDLTVNGLQALRNATPFRQMIRSLRHLASTVQPDMGFAICYLSRIMHKATKTLWKAGKHVSRNLSASQRLVVAFSTDSEETSWVYSDADWEIERSSCK